MTKMMLNRNPITNRRKGGRRNSWMENVIEDLGGFCGYTTYFCFTSTLVNDVRFIFIFNRRRIYDGLG